MSERDIRCPSCGSVIDEDDLFCANCGTESPAEKPPAAAPAEVDSSRIAKCNFECKGCGASMSYDAGAKALRCPFCGSVELAAQKDRKILAPRFVVPFAVERGQAVAAMRQWLGQGFWRPRGLSQSAQVLGMNPVYVPYWVFQADTHTYWTADSSHTPPGARGHWFPMAGNHEASYQSLLIGASGVLSPAETDQLCPFDLSKGVPPGQVDLENVTDEAFSLSRKYARPLVRAGLEQLEEAACTSAYVPGRARNVHVNVQITGMTGQPALLPVWIMAYRFRDRVFRFLVNGQTGKAAGRAPISVVKITAAILIAVLVLLLLLLLAGVLNTGPSRSGPRISQNVRAEPPSIAAATIFSPALNTVPGRIGTTGDAGVAARNWRLASWMTR